MPAFRLTAVGFDKTETIFFRTTMEMASEYDLAEWLWVADRDADVILVNSDINECTTKFKLDKPTEGKIRPILIFCSSKEKAEHPDRYTLQKPITYSKIISLLQKLEKELNKGDGQSSSAPEKQDKASKGSISSIYPQKPGSEKGDTLSAISSLPSSYSDNQSDSELSIPIDEDSDYDIYDILMDSEFDTSDSDTSITADAKPQYAANDQSDTPSSHESVKTKGKKDLPNKRHFEKKRFIGLFKKHVLSKIKKTG